MKKPTVFIGHDEINYIEFDGVQQKIKMFKVIIHFKDKRTPMKLENIQRSEYNGLFDYFDEKKLRIQSMEQQRRQREMGTSSSGRVRNVQKFEGLDSGDSEESDEDSDFEMDESGSDESDEVHSNICMFTYLFVFLLLLFLSYL